MEPQFNYTTTLWCEKLTMPSFFGSPEPVEIVVQPQVASSALFTLTIHLDTFVTHALTVQLGCSHPEVVRYSQGEWPLRILIPLGESRVVVPLRAIAVTQMTEVRFWVASAQADITDPAAWRAQATTHVVP